MPNLPTIQWSEIQGSKETLVALETYEARLVDSWLEHRVIVEVLCGGEDK